MLTTLILIVAASGITPANMEKAFASAIKVIYLGRYVLIPQDKNVKAIVLRVDSGGGSAIASEAIWRNIIVAKKVRLI